MSNYDASVWERSMDQQGRPCWVNRHTRQATYHLQDSGGFPLPQNHAGNCWMGMGMPSIGAHPMTMMGGMAPPVASVYLPAVAHPMTMVGGMAPPVAPVCPPAAHTVAIVGDKVKADKWIEYTDDATGQKYYHNEAKPKDTTWDKPKDFDKQKNAGKPAPPTKPKTKPPKYSTSRKGLL